MLVGRTTFFIFLLNHSTRFGSGPAEKGRIRQNYQEPVKPDPPHWLTDWLFAVRLRRSTYRPEEEMYIGILNSNSWPTDLIRNSTVKKRRKFSLKKGPFCTVKLIFANGCGFFKTILLKLNFRYNVLNWTFSTGIQYKA